MVGQGRRVGCCRGIAGPVLTETCVAGLQCVCQLCEHTNFTCQTEGACWASVMLTNGKEEVIKSCVSLPELNAQVFCHSSKNITKTECCYTDFCNNITLRLPVGACCGAALGAGSRTEAEGGGVYGCQCWGESCVSASRQVCLQLLAMRHRGAACGTALLRAQLCQQSLPSRHKV